LIGIWGFERINLMFLEADCFLKHALEILLSGFTSGTNLAVNISKYKLNQAGFSKFDLIGDRHHPTINTSLSGDTMTQVVLGENESIDSALRRFKRQVSKAGIFPDIKRRSHFETPIEKRKRKAIARRRKKRNFRSAS